MPALRMLKRRWSIATDDVPVLSLFPTLFHGVWTVALGVGWIVLGRPGLSPSYLSLEMYPMQTSFAVGILQSFSIAVVSSPCCSALTRLVHMMLTASATAVQMAAPRALATPSCWRACSSAS